MTNVVIPPAEAFGGRVTPQTQLGRVVAVLRAHNPDASYRQIKAVASELCNAGLPEPESGESEVSGERAPVPFDSAAGDNPATVGSSEPPEVGGWTSRPVAEVLADLDQRKPSRAEVEAWLATQKRSGLVMSKSGRIPATVLVAWREARRAEVLASMVPVEGGSPMPAEPPVAEVY